MALKIQYASDLHIEFPENKKFLNQFPLEAVGDILVLAGDVVPFNIMEKHHDFFNYLSDNFEATYWLPGNHEYYHFDAALKCGELFEKVRDNVFLVNNLSVKHENVQLIFSTLWSKISLAHEKQIEYSMNDFRLIKFNKQPFTAKVYNALHEDCLSFLQSSLSENYLQKTLVFTHHCPTFQNYPKQYKGDILNEAFAVELFDLIESSKIDYWVYGHHHTNISEFNINNTKMITNQLGYLQQHEHRLFDRNKCIELS